MQHQLKNVEEEILSQPDKVKKEYAKYYQALLKTKQAKTSEEQQAEITVEKQFTEIMNRKSTKKEKESLKTWSTKR